jgi:hypothetical protein
LDEYDLRKKIDEGSNLNVMTTILKFVVSCKCLGLEENFQGFCFGHVFGKACQYVTTNEKMCRNLSMFMLSLFNQICKNV